MAMLVFITHLDMKKPVKSMSSAHKRFGYAFISTSIEVARPQATKRSEVGDITLGPVNQYSGLSQIDYLRFWSILFDGFYPVHAARLSHVPFASRNCLSVRRY